MKTSLGLKSKSNAARPLSFVVFSVGGRRLATRVEEVGGVGPWVNPTVIPSHTPYVNAMIRQGEEFLPVFDLSASLGVAVKGDDLFCLVAKHGKGPMAICIDEDIPSIHTVEQSSITPPPGKEPGVVGSCLVGSEKISIFSFLHIGALQARGAH